MKMAGFPNRAHLAAILSVTSILITLFSLPISAEHTISMHAPFATHSRYAADDICRPALSLNRDAALDIYVNGQHGDDADDGSAEAPFKTITHSLVAVAATEDSPITIHVAASTYSASQNGESFPLNMKSWVSLVGEGAEITVLDAEGSSVVINISAVKGATLSGFTITGGAAMNGGGIACSNSLVSIVSNTITGNTADSGAGVYCLSNSPVFQDNRIVGNIATGRLGLGGAMFMVNASPQIIGNTISENIGDKVGCIYIYESSPTIEGNTIADNVAIEEAAYAGGIYIQRGAPMISGNLIIDNAATSGSGLVGAIYAFMASGSIEDNDISGNTVSGDDALVGGIYCFKCSPAITNNTLRNNSSTGVGAIYCLESSPDISGNVIEGNWGLVGGICAAEDSYSMIVNNRIADNVGFGIGCFPDSAPTIVNNLITGNRASYYGASGIWSWGCSATISNCTIVSNAGFGIVNYREQPTVQNCIVWNNGDDLWNCAAMYCCIGHLSDHGMGNIFDDPLFAHGPFGDYYLDPASCCIDAGGLSAADAGLSNYTTQADGSLDTGQVDIGYHYPVD